MGNINAMRQAYSIVHPGMDVNEFIRIAGNPDGSSIGPDSAVYWWDAPVWKGIFRGGYVHRKVTIFSQNGKIVSWSSDSLDRSNW